MFFSSEDIFSTFRWPVFDVVFYLKSGGFRSHWPRGHGFQYHGLPWTHGLHGAPHFRKPSWSVLHSSCNQRSLKMVGHPGDEMVDTSKFTTRLDCFRRSIERWERDRFTNQLINSSCFFLPINPSAVILHGVYVRERNDTSHPRYTRLEHRKIVLLNKGTTIFQKANQMDNNGTGTRHQFNLYTQITHVVTRRISYT